MNTKIITLVALVAAATAPLAHGYVSGQAAPNLDPSVPEREYRVVKKSATAGVSDAISKGDILKYDTVNNNDGYTVTRVGGNNVASAALIACIAETAIATGNAELVRCISKGYVDFTQYDAAGGFGIRAGQKVCQDTDGQAIPCAACDPGTPGFVNDCRLGTATENSPITALEAKASGTGANLKVYINAK